MFRVFNSSQFVGIYSLEVVRNTIQKLGGLSIPQPQKDF